MNIDNGGGNLTKEVALQRFTYNETKKGITINSVIEDEDSLVIPRFIESVPVTKIKKGACKGNTKLINVLVLADVKEIPDSMFYGCAYLKTVFLGVHTVEIGNSAFAYCTSLTDLNINGKLKKIGHLAFEKCYSLKKIYIPETVKYIGSAPFMECKSLKIEISDYNKSFEIKDDYFLIDIEESLLIQAVMADKETKLVLPSSVEYIGCLALSYLTNLKEFILSKNCRSIDNGAFSSCESLERIEITSKIEFIGMFAFSDCKNLSWVFIPLSTYVISEFAFKGCKKAKIYCQSNGAEDGWSIVAFEDPSNVVYSTKAPFVNHSYSIKKVENNEYCFDEGTTHLTIPYGVEKINDEEFSNWDMTSVSIPNSVKVIGDKAFSNCSKLTEIIIPNSVELIDSYAFSGCPIKEIIIPDSVTTIGGFAFSGCIFLEKVYIPKSVRTLGSCIFGNCDKLVNITIDKDNQYFVFDNGVIFSKDRTSLYEYLSSKEDTAYFVPSTVKKVLSFSINNNDSLIGLFFHPKVEVLEEFAVCFNPDLLFIYLDPKTKASPSSFAEVKKANLFTSSKDTKWNSSVFREERPISYETSFEDLSRLNLDAVAGDELMRALNVNRVLTFDDDEKSIEKEQFYYDVTITKVIMSNKIKEIGREAFMGCISLREIEFSSKLERIEEFAFSYCTSLIDVKLPESVKFIGESAFDSCVLLRSIHLGNKLEELGSCAFRKCMVLEEIEIPSSVKEIGVSLFIECKNLNKVISENSKFIYQDGQWIYKYLNGIKLLTGLAGCYDTKSIEIEPEVQIIEPFLFYKFGKLEHVTLPDGLLYIGSGAFSLCNKLKSIFIPNSVEKMEQDIFVLTDNATIYVEAEEKPETWNMDWNGGNSKVVWGASRSDIEIS